MSRRFQLDQRASGVLLHPTSLPGPHGCGDLGAPAYRFADFLAEAGQRWWQVLPIGPADQHGCPYSAFSAFAGDSNLISLRSLHEDGLLNRAEVGRLQVKNPVRVDYRVTRRFRDDRLRRAFARFQSQPASSRRGLERFRSRHRHWLEDWTLFSALAQVHGDHSWWQWTPSARRRRERDMNAVRDQLRDEITFHAFVQYQFDRQWTALKRYCNSRDIGLIGDIPIFVAHESCDVWSEPKLFRLQADGTPTVVSGAAPDAFSDTGQLWNHPLYNWPTHTATDYDWWVRRFRHGLAQFDAVRIDHFLGFARYWEVPTLHRDPRRGRWRRVPGVELFTTLERELGKVPIIAEDLGLVTPEALALRARFGYPGMRVLQCGFNSDDSYHLPHNYPKGCVAYTGTHDNDTLRGWFAKAGRKAEKGQMSERHRALAYTGGSPRTLHWDMIRVTLGSVADTTIFPLQDLLGLGNRARMNVPGTLRGNWVWRLKDGQLTPKLAQKLHDQVVLSGRD